MDKPTTDRGRSVAVWCKVNGKTSTRSPEHSSQMQLHFNYWRVGSSIPQQVDYKGPLARGWKRVRKFLLNRRLRQNKSTIIPDFLDIGVMMAPLEQPDCVEAVFIYLPVTVAIEDLQDLGPKFKEPSIATGIFNERLSVLQESSRRIEIFLSEKKFCRVHCFAHSDDSYIDKKYLDVEPFKGGTKITITKKAIKAVHRDIDNQEWVYFRFRVLIREPSDNTFVKTIRPSDNRLLSGFDAIEYVDFRLNEARNLPNEIEELMEDDLEKGEMPISRIDFLLVLRVGADLVGGHHDFKKNRLLEKELWNDYISNSTSDILQEGMVIYHWRVKEEINDNVTNKNNYSRLFFKVPDKRPKTASKVGIQEFNAFVKLKIRVSNKAIIFKYLLIIIVLGAFGSALESVVPYQSFFSWLMSIWSGMLAPKFGLSMISPSLLGIRHSMTGL